MSQRQRHKLSAAVFVVLARGTEICMLRRKGTGWMDGWFSIPAGGLEAAETISMAAIRETSEEVGIEIDSNDLEYAHTSHCLTAGEDWVGHFFLVRVWSGTPRIREPDKHDELAWYSMDTLPETTIPYVRQALRCIASGQRYSEFGWPAASGES